MNSKFRSIQNIIFPHSDICSVPELYYRSENAVYREREGVFEFNGQVSFDTYFNTLPVGKYIDNCKPSDFSFSLRASGSFILRVYSVQSDGEGFRKDKAAEFEVDSQNPSGIKTELTISPKSISGAAQLYFTVEGTGRIFSGYYGMKNETESDIRLGIIICTYKREKILSQNLGRINAFLVQNKIFSEENIHVYVIDNGRTLSSKDINNPFVTLIHNTNSGGSGGFRRGLYEAVNSSMKFTNILFMDDDIILDCEVLYRLYMLLVFMRSDIVDTAVAGTMLNLSDMITEHESGAVWNGKQIFGIGYSMDMTKPKNVYRTAYFPKGNYGGWWFYCFPSDWADKYGYPLPFFVKIDDIEYSLRCAKNILVMNGLAVWHEDFGMKYDGYQEYYIKRNELILSSVNDQKPYTLFQIRKLVVNIIKQLAFQRYFLADLVLRAYEDYLCGWESFARVSPEKLNNDLLELCPKMLSDDEIMQKYGIHFDEEKYQISMTQNENLFVQALTCNGYTMPYLFYYNDSEGFAVADLARCRAVNFYRHKKVLQYDKSKKVGYVTNQSKREFVRLIARTIAVSVKFALNYKKVRSGYKENLRILSSPNFR